MQHDGHRARARASGTSRVRVAGVDHERQAQLVGQLDLRGEHSALVVARGVVSVEVEAELAQRDHPRVGQQRAQSVDVRLGRLVRVPADGGPNAGRRAASSIACSRPIVRMRSTPAAAPRPRGLRAPRSGRGARGCRSAAATRGKIGSGWCTSLPAASIPSGGPLPARCRPGSPTASSIVSAEAGMYGCSSTPSDRTVSASV